jgi:hypothetical protein
MTDGGRGVALYSPFSNKRVFLPARFIPVSPFVGVVRSQAALDRWAIDARRRVTKPGFAMWLPEKFLSLSDDLGWTRFLFICGVIATEALLAVPLFLLALAAPRLLRTRDGPVELEPRPPPRPLPPWPGTPPRFVAWALVAAGVALLSTHFSFRYRNRLVTVERQFLDDEHRTPYLRVRKTQGRTGASALLVPGSRMASQSMLPMARMLARNGIDAYSIDFPGHGVSASTTDYTCSTEGLRGRRCRSAYWYAMIRDGEPVVKRLMEREGLRAEHTAYVGHSIGGTLMDYELGEHQWGRFRARINLEGRARNLTRGGNHLFVASPAALRYIRLNPPVPANQVFGDFADASAYKLRTVLVPHAALVRDDLVNRETVRWIQQSFQWKHELKAFRSYADLSMTQAALAFLCLALAFEVGLRPLANRLKEPLWERRGSLIVAFGALGIARILVDVLPRLVPAVARLHGVGALAVVFLAVSGILLAPVALGRGLRPSGRQAVLEGAVGVGAFVALYASLGWLVDSQFFGVRLTAARIPRLIGLTLALFPLCHVLTRRLRGTPSWSAQPLALLRLSGVWIGALLLFGSGVITALRTEAMLLGALASGAEALATVLYVRLRSPVATATLVASMIGWFCAVAYPLVS